MIAWLLARIPQYRTLLTERDLLHAKKIAAEQDLNARTAQLAESADRRIELEDELRDTHGKYEDALVQLAESRRREVAAVQAVADFASQMLFGRKIYASAPDLPAETPPTETVIPTRPQGRQLVDEYTRKFYEQYTNAGIE